MNFVVLASGKGKRIKSLTKNYPKAIIKVTKKLRILDFVNFAIPVNFKKIAVLGYKFQNTINFFLKKNFIIIKNKNYNSTNMVETMFCSIEKLNKTDVIVIYSDIIFEKKLIQKLIRKRGNIIPLNSNWIQNWKKRMKNKEILKDAENITTKNGKIINLGGKIIGKKPKYQFMGIAKFKYSDFIKLRKFYKKLNNQKIDFTTFINLSIKKKIINIGFISTKTFWTEIDSVNDLKVCKRIINYELPSNYIKNIERQL